MDGARGGWGGAETAVDEAEEEVVVVGYFVLG